jgi:hypothetical protein
MNNCNLPLICENPFKQNRIDGRKSECDFFQDNPWGNCHHFMNGNFCSCKEAQKEYAKNLIEEK